MKARVTSIPLCMQIAGKIIKVRNISFLQAVSSLHVRPHTHIDTIHQGRSALSVFSFHSIIVNFIHSCNGADCRLNLNKMGLEVFQLNPSEHIWKHPQHVGSQLKYLNLCCCYAYGKKLYVDSPAPHLFLPYMFPLNEWPYPLYWLFFFRNCWFISAPPGDVVFAK